MQFFHEYNSGLSVPETIIYSADITQLFKLFGDQFSKENIAVVAPNIDEQQYIHEKLMSEIELGIFTDATQRQLLLIVENMRNRHNIDAVILGCTELPLIFSNKFSKIPFLNTTEIHVAAICQHCIHVV